MSPLLKEHKVQKRYWTITEVSRELKIPTSTIRYWEQEAFPGFFRSKRKDDQKIRKYDLKNLLIIKKIHHLLYVEKYTIKGAKQKLA